MTELRSLPNNLTVASINRNETDYLYQEIFCDRSYLPDGGFQLPKKPVIFDVGANIGMFSIFACLEWPESRVFAFEPAPPVFAALEQNIAERDNVSAHMIALGTTPGIREFTFYPRYTIMSGFDADADADQELVKTYIHNVAARIDDDGQREDVLDDMNDLLHDRFSQETLTCRVDSIANFTRTRAVPGIDLLKVDVEGAEESVLEGLGSDMWEKLGNAVVEVADRHGELDRVMRLFSRHHMHPQVIQAADYKGTNLFLVYATRMA